MAWLWFWMKANIVCPRQKEPIQGIVKYPRTFINFFRYERQEKLRILPPFVNFKKQYIMTVYPENYRKRNPIIKYFSQVLFWFLWCLSQRLGFHYHLGFQQAPHLSEKAKRAFLSGVSLRREEVTTFLLRKTRNIVTCTHFWSGSKWFLTSAASSSEPEIVQVL